MSSEKPENRVFLTECQGDFRKIDGFGQNVNTVTTKEKDFLFRDVTGGEFAKDNHFILFDDTVNHFK